MLLLVLLRWSLPHYQTKISITPSLAFLCLALLGHFGGGDSHCWLVTLAGALWDHFPACLPASWEIPHLLLNNCIILLEIPLWP